MAKFPNGQMAKLGGLRPHEKGRLRPDFIERVEAFSDRCLAVAETLDEQGCFRRFVEQLAASGASSGANIAEADEAMSDKDFRKCLAIAVKELVETRFYLRLCIRRGWLSPARLLPLLAELHEVKKIVGSILTKTAPSHAVRKPPRSKASSSPL